MKYLFTIFFIAGCVFVTKGQTEISTAQAVNAKIYTELLASSEKIVRGAPFAAEAVNESVQTLSDGNRIVRSSNTKMYRDSEGRFRRDGSVSAGTTIGFYTGVGATTITDPVTGFKYFLNDKDKTVRRWIIKTPVAMTTEAYEKLRTRIAEGSVKITEGTVKPLTALAMVDMEKALVAHGQALTIVTAPSAGSPQAQAELEKAIVGKVPRDGTMQITTAHTDLMRNYQTNTESLGTKNIEGVDAEGSRTTTTIPAGAIGNERPIDIVYEKWYSKELQLIVYSRHSDPRYGDQTYKLVNINRSEPDPSMFTVPGDYKLKAEGFAPAVGSGYRLATAPRVRTTVAAPGVVATPGAVAAPRPVTVTTAPKKVQ